MKNCRLYSCTAFFARIFKKPVFPLKGLGVFLTLLIVLSGCGREETPSRSSGEAEYELPDNGIEIADAWARPARENGVTAVYMQVLNGSSSADTLLEISSPVAAAAELHETFDREDGMTGMREAESPVFPSKQVTSLEPGGLHMMLMQLNSALEVGEEIEVVLLFSEAGEITITVPVQAP